MRHPYHRQMLRLFRTSSIAALLLLSPLACDQLDERVLTKDISVVTTDGRTALVRWEKRGEVGPVLVDDVLTADLVNGWVIGTQGRRTATRAFILDPNTGDVRYFRSRDEAAAAAFSETTPTAIPTTADGEGPGLLGE